MTMTSHITNFSRTITLHLRNILRIRRYIDADTCHHAVRSLILSRIDCCNGLLSSLPKSYTLRLQRLQNWAARPVFTVNRQQDPKPLLKSLHCLPVKERISVKLLWFVFKSLNGMALAASLEGLSPPTAILTCLLSGGFSVPAFVNSLLSDFVVIYFLHWFGY